MRKTKKRLLLPSFSSGSAALAAREAKASKPGLKAGRSPKKIILALGAESAGNFSVFHNNQIHFSENFGDLLQEKNYKKFQTAVLNFLKKNKLKPDIILTDLHPEYKTTLWSAELAKKYKAKHIQVQHHIAHIFSAVGEDLIFNFQFSIFKQFSIYNFQLFGIALDGTGYGLDDKIWGGEVFECRMSNVECRIKRIGHLENQIMIGGDLAVKEPARMLISILDKFSISNFQFSNNFQFKNFQTKKDFIYNFVKKYYTKNQFELLYNQLQNNFNCIETSSTGRVLDAVSVLLGFSKNERNYKHGPIDLLEKNSTKPYANIKPKIKNNILLTTPLFEYLIKNLHKDKKRLAATAQLYIAEGLYGIIKNKKLKIYLSGGISGNKIISSYLESKSLFMNKKKPSKNPAVVQNKKVYPVKSEFNGVPRGDAGLSFGQICYFLAL